MARRMSQVHEAVLDDLVYPTEIVGKRVRYKVDGSKTLKVGPCLLLGRGTGHVGNFV